MDALLPADPRTVGEWRLQGRIGSGGMGVVFLAKRGRQVAALKIIGHVDGPDAGYVRRFKRELASLVLVSGPHVAALIDADMDTDPAWIAFEYIDGLNLKQHVERNGRLAGDDWEKFAVGLLQGIVQVHSKGIVHRDIKPSNILLCDGQPKLIDFGIAQAPDATRFTGSGVAGTPGWMAPEQVIGNDVGKPADLFVAGLVLLYAASGREPVGVGAPGGLQDRFTGKKPYLAGLTDKQRRLISALLINNPKARPSAEVALQILAGALRWPPVDWRKVLGACSGVALVIIGIWYWVGFGLPPEAPDLTATPNIVVQIVPSATPVSITPTGSAGDGLEPDVAPISVADAGRVHQIAFMALGSNPHSVVFLDDGLLLAAGFADGSVKFVGVPSGVVVKNLVGHTKVVQVVALSRDGKTLASGSFDNTIKLWDVASGLELRTFTGHSNPVFSVAFSPDGQTILSAAWSSPDLATANDGVILWDVATGGELARFEGQSSVVSVAFAPDGKTVVAGGAGSPKVAIWDIESRRIIRELPFPLGVFVVAYSPDGGQVVASSYDGSIAVWDANTGRAGRTMVGHKNLVFSLAFSPNGKLLVSGSKDNTIKLWEVATARELRNLTSHSNSVFGVAFSPDGTTFASASVDGAIRIWDGAVEVPQYSLLDFDGKYLRWDPCEGAINVSVNFGSMDSDQRELITGVVTRVLGTLSRLSGLEFVYAGATSEVLTARLRESRDGKSAVLIAFVPTAEVSLFAGENTWRSTSPTRASREWWAIQSAEIRMDISDKSLYWPNSGIADYYMFQRMFEVAGLDFVASQYEVMGKSNSVAQTFRVFEFAAMNLELGPGDILGLQAVGAAQGCIVE